MSRKNVSLTKPIDERAAAIIHARGFTGLSDMIAVLVREEFERRQMKLEETPPPYNVSSTADPAAVSAAGDQVVEIVSRDTSQKRRHSDKTGK